MCGICGFVSKVNISKEELKEMNNTMVHRGPDDDGVEIFYNNAEYEVGLAHRRLSIQDLSPLGHQPMSTPDDRVVVVFNGEIYNFIELKEELKAFYPFKSNCDTEVILACYQKWGMNFVEHIHGMFALVLYDKETDDAILVRDRIGKKPLYYCIQNGNLIFGSELKPIMKCHSFEPRIRKDVLPRYLYNQYINAPDCIFENVWQVEPGQIIKFNNGDVKKRKYWSIKDTYKTNSIDFVESYDEAKAELKKRLKKAVSRRMIADVPLGTFLSGGYDSSLITALAQENSSQPVKTFSIGFNVPEYNEAIFAKNLANYLGTDHTEFYIDESEMLELVDSIPKYYDEPFADSSEIPTMLVSRLAKESVTVALSGDGGDEFFCGYNRYQNIALAQKLDTIGALVNCIGKAPFCGGIFLKSLPLKVRVIADNRNPDTKTQFASQTYERHAHAFISGKEDIYENISFELYSNNEYGDMSCLPCKYPVETFYGISDWQIRRMLLDMDTYLPSDILVKVDRASMKYSLECRCPIMDTDVMEYSFSIPHRYKFMNGDKKHILKDITHDYIPKTFLDRPKTGFSVPIDQWLRGPLRDRLCDYSDERYLRNQNVFDSTYVSGFIKNYIEKGDLGVGSGHNFSSLVWSFFVFQQWYEQYM